MISLTAFSQESSFYIGYKSMREVNTSFDYALGYNKKVGATIGFIFATKDEINYGHYHTLNGVVPAFFRKRNQQGVSLSTYFNLRNGFKGKYYFSISLEYQYLKSGNYIYHFKGYNYKQNNTRGGEYEEFKNTYNNFALLLGLHHEFLKHRRAEVYFEAGFAYKSIHRDYSVRGYYDNQKTSTDIETFAHLTPTFRIGLNFRILSFGEKIENPNLKERRRAIKQRQSNSRVRML